MVLMLLTTQSRIRRCFVRDKTSTLDTLVGLLEVIDRKLASIKKEQIRLLATEDILKEQKIYIQDIIDIEKQAQNIPV